ncbi:unknown protein [Desulfotalea psychrophila LSv54]|uniref:Uncharacterized protein n=1 Tax=Desulfotalea psychrophila (strain LSv54 / DSM 12343) TaxID=177439 RepID=Q6APX7_DESPS|nr:unknown protein [Desulfotalea psychrophila LSv54]
MMYGVDQEAESIIGQKLQKLQKTVHHRGWENTEKDTLTLKGTGKDRDGKAIGRSYSSEVALSDNEWRQQRSGERVASGMASWELSANSYQKGQKQGQLRLTTAWRTLIFFNLKDKDRY